MAKVTKKPAAKKAVKAAVNPASPKVGLRRTGKPVVKKVAVKKAAVKKPVVKPAVKKVTPKAPSGIPEQLLAAALKVLDEKQAEEIVTIPLAGRSSVADYLIIASGRAGRQVAALADHLCEAFSKLGVRRVRIEGMGEANWVLVDAGDIVIHLFRPEVRRYYDLDGIWNRKTPKE